MLFYWPMLIAHFFVFYTLDRKHYELVSIFLLSFCALAVGIVRLGSSHRYGVILSHPAEHYRTYLIIITIIIIIIIIRIIIIKKTIIIMSAWYKIVLNFHHALYFLSFIYFCTDACHGLRQVLVCIYVRVHICTTYMYVARLNGNVTDVSTQISK